MNADTLDKLNDQELAQLIAAAQGLQQARAEKRKIDAMEQIRRIAATAQIIVTFDAARKSRRRTILRAGDRYVNPGDSSQSYVVGKGKQPNWFVALREKGRVPPPVASDLLKPKES